MWRDTAIALSLANLAFLPVWYRGVPIATQADPRFVSYSETACWGALIGLALLAIVFRLSIVALRRSSSRLVHDVAAFGCIVLLLLVVGTVLRHELPAAHQALVAAPLASPAKLAGVVIIGGAAVLLLARFRDTVVRVAGTLALVLLPFVLVTVGRTLALAMSFVEPTTAPPLPVPARAPRVLWMVFDELDQRLAFAERPPSLALPELDRLRRQAIELTDARPPADITLLSMPSLITGRTVAESRSEGTSEQLLRFTDDGHETRWSQTPTVFTRARSLGVNAGLVGWYYQYDRLLGSSLVRCAYWDNLHLSAWSSAMGHLGMVLVAAPVSLVDVVYSTDIRGSYAGAWNKRSAGVARYLDMLADGASMATDRQLGLVFLHWPIPHVPLIYDRRAASLSATARSTYFDNLALVDRTVGDIRRAMEAQGLWDDAVVIVTSDHPVKAQGSRKMFRHADPSEAAIAARGHDPRIPFILKLPGQREGIEVGARFNTVATQDLVLDLLAGTVSTPDQVVRWLESRSLSAQ